MTVTIGRRELLTALGGAAAWPLAARAPQPAMPLIGFLNPAFTEANADRLRGFHRGLKDAGYVEGENVAVVYRWAEGQNDRSAHERISRPGDWPPPPTVRWLKAPFCDGHHVF